MLRLLPGPVAEVDPDDAYRARRPPRPDRPWVLMNMIASVDGAIAVDGVSGGLGSDGDKAVFGTIRTLPDVILAGAATVRAEQYGPPSSSVSVRARRLAQGATAEARIAVVSGRLDLDLETPLFTTPSNRPIVVTHEASDEERRHRIGEVADVVVAGDTTVDPTAMLGALAGLGARVVLSEGGPTLNGQLVAADLIDEVCVTIAAVLAAGASPRLAHGPEPDALLGLELAHVLTADGDLFLRYVRPA